MTISDLEYRLELTVKHGGVVHTQTFVLPEGYLGEMVESFGQLMQGLGFGKETVADAFMNEAEELGYKTPDEI